MRSYAPSLLLAILGSLMGTCSGQSNHTCSMPQPVANFSVDTFLGTWHGQKMYLRLAENGSLENGKSLQYRCLDIVCSRTESTFLPLLAEDRFISIEDGPDYVLVSESIHLMHENKAIWKMLGFYKGQLLESDSVVVQTDYYKWAIFYRCPLEDDGRHEQMQIWTRTRNPDPELMDILEEVVQGYGFPLENGQTIEQTNCTLNQANIIEPYFA